MSIQHDSPRNRQRNKLLIEHQVVESVRSQRSHADKLTGKWQKADEYLAPKQPSASLGCSQNETVEWAINSLKCILLLYPKGRTATLGELRGREKQMPKIQPSLSHRNKSFQSNLHGTAISWGRAFRRPLRHVTRLNFFPASFYFICNSSIRDASYPFPCWGLGTSKDVPDNSSRATNSQSRLPKP